MTDKIETVCEQLAKNTGLLELLIYKIVKGAALYFERCPDDFCLQYFGGETIVFGGTNRLTFNPLSGYHPDRSYCTERFLARYREIGPNPGNPP